VKKIVLLVLLLLSTLTFAQSGQYAGAFLGYPIAGIYGLEDFLGKDADLRFRVSLSPFYGLGVGVGADALFDIAPLPLDEAGKLRAYGGGGAELGFASYRNSFASVSVFTIDALGILGVDYPIDKSFGVFFETGLGIGFNIGGYSSIVGAPSVGFFSPAFRGGIGIKFKL
jgi:hypothetical protein